MRWVLESPRASEASHSESSRSISRTIRPIRSSSISSSSTVASETLPERSRAALVVCCVSMCGSRSVRCGVSVRPRFPEDWQNSDWFSIGAPMRASCASDTPPFENYGVAPSMAKRDPYHLTATLASARLGAIWPASPSSRRSNLLCPRFVALALSSRLCADASRSICPGKSFSPGLR